MIFLNIISVSVGRRLAAILLGGVILWWVAANARPADCEVVIHVVAQGLDVAMDGRAYPVASDPYSPIVFQLQPGRHTLTISRGTEVVREESFSVSGGEHLVLTPYDPNSPSPGSR
jgi:hypothetical protein